MTEVSTTGTSVGKLDKDIKVSEKEGGEAGSASTRSTELNRNLERATQLAIETLKDLSQRRD